MKPNDESAKLPTKKRPFRMVCTFSNLKLMFDRLVCMNGGNPDEKLIDHEQQKMNLNKDVTLQTKKRRREKIKKMIHEIFDKIGSPVLWIIFIALFFLEKKFQLRKRVRKITKRTIINFIVSIPAFVLLRVFLIPEMVWLAMLNQQLQVGLNYFLPLPTWLGSVVAFLLLDYSNYLWHILNHKIPLLWRFHVVHHTDHDLDVTTAIRFHFGEIIGSAVFRAAAVFLIGASPLIVLVYEIVFEAATQFHHSNMKLPFKLEKILNTLIVTPRMHGIHHSVIHNETDSNYSVIFSFWDRIHRTVKLNIPQDQVVIGVPSYSDREELTIGFLLKLPFTKIKKWEDANEERKFNEANELAP